MSSKPAFSGRRDGIRVSRKTRVWRGVLAALPEPYFGPPAIFEDSDGTGLSGPYRSAFRLQHFYDVCLGEERFAFGKRSIAPAYGRSSGLSAASLATLEEGQAFLNSLALAKKSQANAPSTSEGPESS